MYHDTRGWAAASRADPALPVAAAARAVFKKSNTNSTGFTMKSLLGVFFMMLVSGSSALCQELRWTASAHPQNLQVNGVAFSADGMSVLSGTNCHPSVISLYESSTGKVRWSETLSDSFMCLMGVGFSSNGRYFAAIEEMGNVLIYDNTVESPVMVSAIPMGTTYAFSLCFSPSSDVVLAGGSNGRLQAYYTSDGAMKFDRQAHSWVTAVAYSPDETVIASGGNDRFIKLWSADGTLLRTLEGHSKQISALRFSSDSKTLFSASFDGQIMEWDVATGEKRKLIWGWYEPIYGLDLSPDGRYLVYGFSPDSLIVWDMQAELAVIRFSMPGGTRPMCVAWSPTDASFAVGSQDGKVSIYDVDMPTGVYGDDPMHSVTVLMADGGREIVLGGVVAEVRTIELIDFFGRQIAKKEIDLSSQLNSLQLPHRPAAGAYFVRVTFRDYRSVVRMVVY